MRYTDVRWLLGIALLPAVSVADEGGVSFWVPGQMSTLAAAPAKPGWSMPLVYYHTSADQNSSRGTRLGGQVAAGVEADANLLFAIPTYTFSEPLLGGQAALSVVAAVGEMAVDADVLLSGPRGRTIERGASDSLKGSSDLYPLATLKWNHGEFNYMVYSMGNIPVGAYDPDRLVNLGLGHWSLDLGGGFTFFDKKNEFSAVLGVTHNWENRHTDYKNGVDAHLDWSASHFVTETTHIGLVGYVYEQITGDSGDGAVLGDYKSRVRAVGPQLGHFFKVGTETWYANLKGYHEFSAKNRAEGWNMWLTLAIPLGSKS